jgi:hypothetical protein
LAGLVQHSAGLYRVIAAQRPTAGLDRPTIPKVVLALRLSVMTITKERISPPSFAETKPARVELNPVRVGAAAAIERVVVSRC